MTFCMFRIHDIWWTFLSNKSCCKYSILFMIFNLVYSIISRERQIKREHAKAELRIKRKTGSRKKFAKYEEE